MASVGRIGPKEYVKVIDNNQEALLWRLRMINSAKRSIVMFTFKLKDDNSGKDVLSGLIEAAKRGVKEYILVDSVGASLHSRMCGEVKYLASFENVHFCFYNPLFFSNPLRLTFRLHDKILAIDKEVYMIGGRNVLDESIGNYTAKYNIDRDVVVCPSEDLESSSVRGIYAYIESMIRDSAIKEFQTNQLSEESRKKQSFYSEKRQEWLFEKYPEIRRQFTDPAAEGFIAADEVQLISGDPDWRFKGLEIFSRLVRLMKSGENVLVQTPYIMCNELMYQGLREVIKTVNSFAILTNAPEAGANYFGCADYMNQKKKIHKYGIKVYECCAGHSLHTKSILIDDEISIIGSFNFDTRSAYMDTELMLLIRSVELNRKLRGSAEELIKKSRTMDENGEMLYGDSYVGQAMGIRKTLFYAVLRVLVRPFRFLL